MADKEVSKVRVPDGTSNIYVLKDEVARNRTEYEQVTKSGNPLVFESGGQKVDDLKLTLEPIQDLNGYDHPWVGGAGKNKLNDNYYSGSNVSQNNVNIVKNDDGSLSITITGSCSGTVNYLFKNTNASSGLKAGNYKAIIKSEGTYTGNVCLVIGSGSSGIPYSNIVMNNVASFTLSSDDATIGYCLLQFPTGATVTGTLKLYPMIADENADMTVWSPYSNICPISSRSTAEVQWTGKNLIQVTATTQTINGVTFTVNSDGTVTANGTATSNAVLYLNRNFQITDDNEYVLSGTPSGGSTRTYRMECYFRDANNMGKGMLTETGDGITFKMSVFEGAARIDTFVISVLSGVECNNLLFKPMLRLASETNDTFEPYTSQPITVQLGQDVYGGTLDVTTGELSVTHKTISNLDTFDWVYYNGAFYTDVITDAKQAAGKTCISSYYKSVNNISGGSDLTEECSIAFLNNTSFYRFYIKDSRYSTSTLAAALSGMQLTYELATPTTIQLTAQQLKTLVGTNILSMDYGTIELTLRDGMFMLAGEEVSGDTDSETANITLYAAEWSDSIYTISDARITDNSIQEFQAAIGITDDQLKALQKANIQDGGQDTGHAYLRAYGTVPTIDIPIQAIFNRGSKAVDVNMNYSISEIEVPVSGWSSSTTTVDGTAYYTQIINVTSVEIAHPEIQLGASGTLPTATEKSAYGCLDYVTVDIQNSTMTFYASSKPSSAFVIIVEGVKV